MVQCYLRCSRRIEVFDGGSRVFPVKVFLDALSIFSSSIECACFERGRGWGDDVCCDDCCRLSLVKLSVEKFRFLKGLVR